MIKKSLVVLSFLSVSVLLMSCDIDFSEVGEGIDQVTSKALSSSDLDIDSEAGLFHLYVIIKPNVDIDYVNIKLEIMDDDGSIINTETKKFTDLSSSESYKYEYDMSLSNIINADRYRFSFVDGEKA